MHSLPNAATGANAGAVMNYALAEGDIAEELSLLAPEPRLA